MRKFILIIMILSFANPKANAQCDAAFTSSVTQATAQFQATNNHTNYRHFWLFGDGSNGFGASISHTYLIQGTYTVTHILTDSVGHCSDTTQHQVGINLPVTCQSNFSIVRDSTYYSLYFIKAYPQVTGDTAQFYYWTVDGVSVPVPVTHPHFYQEFTPGIHYICLTIVTTTGCTSSLCHTLLVTTMPPCALNASFTHTASVSNPKQVQFSPSPLSNTLRYDWNFGDGHSSSQANPVHVYGQAGTYNVRLVITDTIPGCRDSVWRNVQVHGSPADSCTASFTYAANPSISNQITFTAASNQTITSQTWHIDRWSDPHDSVFLTVSNPTYTFTDTGYYYICLYITTGSGCTRSYCNVIYISSISSGRQAVTIPSYPNPASNSVRFRLNLTEEAGIGITVYNLSGYAVYKTQKQGVAGNNEVNIPVQQLNSGQYFIDIQYGDQRKRSIFQKL